MSTAARVVIVGAGPAGVRAAEALVQSGLRPVLVEEGERDGGQAYRRAPPGFTRTSAERYGADAPKADAVHAAFDALRPHVDHRPLTLAWNVASRELHLVHDGQAQVLPFDALIVASGATDRLLPVPGWHRAGCYSLGGAQVALKAQACAVGARTAFVGTGPLLYLVAWQYLKAGAGVAAVLDTAPRRKSLAAVRGLLERPGLAWRGLAMVRALRRAGVPVLNGVRPQQIDGDDASGVSGITVREASGRTRRVDADAVALGWHLRPETQLADLAGCTFDFDPLTRQWLPQIDADGRSSVPGVYLVGDGARLLGADGAEASGRLAALAVLADLSVAPDRHALEAPALHARLARLQRFRDGLAHAFPWPRGVALDWPDDTVVCRCEAVRAGAVRAAVREAGGREVNRVKAFCRVGMGRCQGRYCGHAAAELVAATVGMPVAHVGRLRGQAPVKPLLMDTREPADDGSAG